MPWPRTWIRKIREVLKLDEIEGIPDLSGHAGQMLVVNPNEDGIDFTTPTDSDEHVKADPTDPSPGYLSDKVDGSTIVVDNHQLKVNVATTDEKVKADPTDPNSGYLSDKVDGITIIADQNTHKIKVDPAQVNSDELVKADVNDPSASYLSDKVDANTIVVNTNTHKLEVVPSQVNDEQVMTDSNDPSPGYLEQKVDGNTIIADLNTHKIAVNIPQVNTDELVKADASDPTAGYLADKIDGVTIVEDANAHKIKVDPSQVNTDELVKTDADDPTADYLENKFTSRFVNLGHVIDLQDVNGLIGVLAQAQKQKAIYMCFERAQNPFINITLDGTDHIVAAYMFAGSNVMGIPARIRPIIYQNAGSDGTIRVYDVTNGQDVVPATAITTSNPYEFMTIPITNYSGTPAVWQIIITGTTGTAHIAGVEIEFD